jgi:hypothetical protein
MEAVHTLLPQCLWQWQLWQWVAPSYAQVRQRAQLGAGCVVLAESGVLLVQEWGLT